MKKQVFYTWFIPVLWTSIFILSFFHPGDEYGLFAFGTLAGSWIAFLHQFEPLVKALLFSWLAGIFILGILGFVMDILRVRKKVFTWLFIIGVVILYIMVFEWFHSFNFEKMLRKDCSAFALVFFASNWSLYITVIICCVATGIKRLWQMKRV